MLLHNDATNATKRRKTLWLKALGSVSDGKQIHVHEETMKAESEQLVTWAEGAEIHWEHTVDG